METAMSTATAAPREVKLSGKTYLVGRFRLEDYGYIEQWMRDQLVAAARSQFVDPTLSQDDKRLILSMAYEAAGKVSFNSEEARGFIQSIGGCLRVAWFALRRHQPGMTIEQVDDILTPESAVDILDMVFQQTTETQSDKPAGKPIDNPADAADPSTPATSSGS